MAQFKSLVKPNLNFQEMAGRCLAMAQGIFGAPVNHPSATAAANATKHRHHNRNIPNATCVLWFDHWGTYGNGVYANWGHVVDYVPGRGYASSSPIPGEWSTPYFYSSISEVERVFNCTFRFWSEDINGLRVCQPDSSAGGDSAQPTKGKKKMLMAYYKDAAGKGQARWAVFGPDFWLELLTQKAADAFAKQLGVTAYVTDKGGWDKFKRVSGGK